MQKSHAESLFGETKYLRIDALLILVSYLSTTSETRITLSTQSQYFLAHESQSMRFIPQVQVTM